MPPTRHWAQFLSGRPRPGFTPTSHRPEHHAMGQSLVGRPLYGSRKKKASFAGSRLNALTLCLLESLGVLLLIPNKASINERLLVHRSVQIIIGMFIGYTLVYR